jgi:hypothetical protein
MNLHQNQVSVNFLHIFTPPNHLKNMTHSFESIRELNEAFPSEDACIKHLEFLRWNGHPISPFDPKSVVYDCSGGRYKCKNTNKYFNVRTGTIFEDSKIPLIKWFVGVYFYSESDKNITSKQLAAELGIGLNTAWLMLRRLQYVFENLSAHALSPRLGRKS